VPLLLLSVYFGFHPRPVSERAGAVAIELGKPAAESRRSRKAAQVVAPASHVDPAGAIHASR
jgi:hypothetical protein